MTQGSFAKDTKTQDAVTRRLEIIGEAVKSLDKMAPEIFASHPEVPWKNIKGMREKLAHDYDTVSVPILWNTATQELPLLREAVRKLATEAKRGRKGRSE